VILPLPTFQQRLIAYMLVFWLHWVVTAAALKRWTALAALAPFGLFGTSEWAFGPLLGAAARLGFALPYLGNRTRRLVQVLVLVTAVAACATRIGAGIAALATSGRTLTEPGPIQLAVAGVFFFLALVTGTFARQGWPLLRTRHAEGRLLRLLTRIALALTAVQGLWVALWLLPPELNVAPPFGFQLLVQLSSWIVTAIVAMAGHATYLLVSRGQPPGTRWLAVNYGVAVAVALSAFLFPLGLVEPTDRAFRTFGLLGTSYIVVATLLCLRRLVLASRRDRWWWTAAHVGVVRADLALISMTLIGLAGWNALRLLRIPGPSVLDLASVLLAWTPLGIVVAARFPGEVLRGITATVFAVVATTAIVVGTRSLTPSLGAVGLDRFGTAVMVAALVPLLLVGYPWLQAWINRTVFGRTRRQQEQLRQFVAGLAPEAGGATRGWVRLARLRVPRG